jgi:vacuolar-type H+-ATPase subunit F/Vma7
VSRLLVVTQPELAIGFQLGGVDAYGVEDVESAQELIGVWLEAGESGLLAIDDSLLAHMEPAFVERLNSAGQLLHIAIPSGGPRGPEVSRQYRIAELMRRAIGFHISFKGVDDKETK